MAATQAGAGAATHPAGVSTRPSCRLRRVRCPVTGLGLLLLLAWSSMSLVTASTSRPAVEETPASSSMLRRRQLDAPAAAEALAAPMDEVDMEAWDVSEWGDVGAQEGDKGWLFGGGGGEEQPRWPYCAWEGTLTRNLSNIFALENTAAYHFLAPWMKWRPGAGVPTFRISSTYPRTAFFDFATYGRGSYMKAIDAIADYQILPTWGKNPFMEPCTPEEVGTYEVYVTLHGDQGYPNEIRLLQNATDHAGLSYLSPVILRFYGVDPSMDRRDPALQVWGGVQAPKVEYLEADGRWVEVPLCSKEQRDFPAPVIERFYKLAQGIDTTRLPGQLSYRGDCPTRSIGNGLVPGMLLHGGSLDVIPVSFQNPHSVYAYWCMSPHVKQIQKEEFFVKLKARLPTIPTALFEGHPRIWQRELYDSRFISITTMDLNVPHRVYQSISGIEIEEFYRARQGEWADRRFTIVAGLTQEGVDACGMLDRGSELWLDWSTGDDVSLHQFRVPHITYRDILSAVDTVPRKGQTATDVSRTCTKEKGAWNDCNNWEYAAQVMGEEYPVVEIWHCDKATGHATQLA